MYRKSSFCAPVRAPLKIAKSHMLEPTVLRRPREFAGDKHASLEEFFAAYTHALGNDPLKRTLFERIRVHVAIERGAMDIGSFLKFPRMQLYTFLKQTDDESWIETFEDVLDSSFHVSTPVVVSQAATAKAKPKKQSNTCKFIAEGEQGVGCRLLANGELDTLKFTRSMFPLITTAEPLLETISEGEVGHIWDVMWNTLFKTEGVVNIDKTAAKKARRWAQNHAATALVGCLPAASLLLRSPVLVRLSLHSL